MSTLRLLKHSQFSLLEHCVNTPVARAFSVLRTRAMCQHSGCRSSLSIPYYSTMSKLPLSEHSQYSVLEHRVNTPVIETFSVLRTRALSQRSGCRSTSTFCESTVSTLRLSEHTQYSVLEHCVNTPVVRAHSILCIRHCVNTPIVRAQVHSLRALYQLSGWRSKYSVLEHCVNTPSVEAQVHSVRALCQHSGCQSTLSTSY
jgi:hypothetical protein